MAFRPISKPRILTDISMPQCVLWGKETSEAPRRWKTIRALPLFRKFEPLFAFFDVLLIYRHFDVVVLAELRTAQLFGLYRTIFFRRKVKQIVLELMLADQRRGPREWVKSLWLKACFRSTNLIFVSAKNEVSGYARRLSIPENRIRFLPFHTNIQRPERISSDDGYIFSGGRSGRDFSTLAKSLEGIQAKSVVVAQSQVARETKFPEGVDLHCDIDYEKYLELVRRAHFVVVPLYVTGRSTGQVVMLEAMALGKPVVATATVGTYDYIQHEQNGLLVPPNDPAALKLAIERLISDEDLYKKLSGNALERVCREHSFEGYVLRILGASWEVMDSHELSVPDQDLPPPPPGSRHRKAA